MTDVQVVLMDADQKRWTDLMTAVIAIAEADGTGITLRATEDEMYISVPQTPEALVAYGYICSMLREPLFVAPRQAIEFDSSPIPARSTRRFARHSLVVGKHNQYRVIPA